MGRVWRGDSFSAATGASPGHEKARPTDSKSSNRCVTSLRMTVRTGMGGFMHGGGLHGAVCAFSAFFTVTAHGSRDIRAR